MNDTLKEMNNLDFSFTETYFHISPNKPLSPIMQISAEDFLDHEKVQDILSAYGEITEATDNILPASFIGMTFCNLCIAQLIFAAQSQQWLDLSLSNLTFYIESSEANHYLGYTINDIQWTHIPENNQEVFLLQYWTSFIEQQIRPAIESISHTASVRPVLIWNQLGGQLSRMKEIFFAENIPQEVTSRFNLAYLMMTELLSPEIFHLKRNPFKHAPRYVENPYNPEEKWMLRSSCCKWDHRKNGEKCYVCPCLTQTQRNDMKKTYTE